MINSMPGIMAHKKKDFFFLQVLNIRDRFIIFFSLLINFSGFIHAIKENGAFKFRNF